MAKVLGRRYGPTPARRRSTPAGWRCRSAPVWSSAEELVFAYDAMRHGSLRAVSPLVVQMYMPNSWRPPSAWSAAQKPVSPRRFRRARPGSEAIANAWRNIVYGEADMAICGGVETKIEAVPIAGFAQMRIVLSRTTTIRPAPAARSTVTATASCSAEAGALMVIETEEHAKARGANILARIMGASVTSDGYHMVALDPDGIQAGQAITRAVQLAGLQPSDIDHINAHATAPRWAASPKGRAINNAMGGHRPAVYAPKSALGHSVGAVGAVESILTVLALREGSSLPR